MRRWLLGAALAILALAALVLAALVWLPGPLLRLALAAAGVDQVAFDTVHLGGRRLEIQGVTLGTPPAQAVRRIEIRYGWPDLFRGELESVAIEGLIVRGRLDETGLEFAGLPAGGGAGGLPPLPEVTRLTVRDAELRLETPLGLMRVPIEAELRPERTAATLVLRSEGARLEDGPGTLTASFELDGRLPLDHAPAFRELAGQGRLSVQGEGLEVAGIAAGLAGTAEVGLAVADGRLRADLTALEAHLDRLEPRFAGLAGILPPPWRLRAGGTGSPLALRAASGPGGWSLQVTGPLALQTAAPSLEASLAAELDLDQDLGLQRLRSGAAELQASGLRLAGLELPHAGLRLEAAGPPDDLQGRADLELRGGGTPADGLTVRGAALRQGLRLALGPDALTIAMADAGQLRADAVEWSGRATARDVALRLQAADLPLLQLEFRDGAPQRWAAAAVAVLADLDADLQAGGAATVRDVAGRVTLGFAGAGRELEQGRLTLVEGAVALPEQALRLRGITTELTVGPDGLLTGQRIPVTIAEIAHQAEPAWFRPLRLEGRVQPGGQRLGFEGALTGEGGRLSLTVRGAHDPARRRGEATVHLAPLEFAPGGLQPAALAPILGRRLGGVSGRLELDGELAWTPERLFTDLALLVADLSLTIGPARLERLNGLIRFDQLLPPRTPPGQQIAVALLDLGLPFTDGLMIFELQGGQRLEVGRLRFRWAGGLLRAEPFSVDSGASAIPVVLKAEGLQLGEIFQLVQLDGLDGQGTINGTLPIRLSGGEAVIAGGELEAAGPGWLRYRPAGPPPGLAQGGQSMDLLLEALENFRYEALRITLDGRTDAAMDVGLHLRGANPGLYDGYPIEFNLNLEGELANILRSGLSSYTIPERIRERMQEFRR